MFTWWTLTCTHYIVVKSCSRSCGLTASPLPPSCICHSGSTHILRSAYPWASCKLNPTGFALQCLTSLTISALLGVADHPQGCRLFNYGNILLCIYSLQCWWTFAWFPVWDFWIGLLWTFLYITFGQHRHSVLWNIFFDIKLLGQR